MLEVDIAYHRAILERGGNDALRLLNTVVAEILRIAHAELMQIPHPDALQWHFDVADAMATVPETHCMLR